MKKDNINEKTLDNQKKLEEVKAQILAILKENNMTMYGDHCHWDGHYIALEICGTHDSVRILKNEV